ncbi:tripartite tricarboxylate transporter substrate binding protein [Ramlibacter sp. XY19]|uniref:Bug family tripartite tricarboxylate transporter substrate binding protein n=1 Tax=Ramlibacter paludis TaxID=2908000 RepID=UPI0023DB90A5|nr:tripartite tricarboxylate transporter substrate-binding protein [Ramlibacter paludis]MCG2592380.1 tripartite tricarboxylate transporter substrate binding protein [Ramlibacter paludis]
MKRRDLVRAAALLPLAPALRAQGWPQRPVKFILSQPAGSGPDILARYVADQLARSWNQAIVIENKPGGQNLIGAQAAARSAPDGYTFYYATTAAMVTNPFTFKSLPYDPAKDFAPVRLVGRSPFIIAAAANFPARDLAEALAKAKAEPGSVSIATEGPKTFSGMLADSVAAMAGVKLNHVPYTKAPDALQDVIGGRVQLVCLPDAALTAYIKGGQVKPLAISTAQRQPDLPNLPTLGETFAGFEYTGWNGLFAPAGTPADVLTRVNRDLEAVLRQPEVAQRMLALGSIVEPKMTVAEFDTFMRGERERWGKTVKVLGIQPE